MQMVNYRIVTIDQAGNLGRHRNFVTDNDRDAIVWAKQLLDKDPVELWSGARFVTRLEPQSALKTNAGELPLDQQRRSVPRKT
jgi:hypothetical protein